MTPRDCADILDRSVRLGADRDEPEGARYIQISDTLARQMADALRGKPTRPDRT